MSQSHGRPGAWLLAVIPLSLYVGWEFGENSVLQFEPELFLPLLTGWLAYRFGPRIVGFLLVLGLFSAFSISIIVFDTLWFGFGGYNWIYFLSIFTAVVFCRPTFPNCFDGILNERWRWLKWLLPVALWPAVFARPDLEFELGYTVTIGTNPGFILLAVLMSASVNWKILIGGVNSSAMTAGRTSLNLLRAAILVLLALGLVIYVDWDLNDWTYLSFGFTDGFGLLIAFAFVLAVTGAADWRYTILFLVFFFASEWPVYWLIDTVQAAFPDKPVVPVASSAADDELFLEEIVVTARNFRHYLFWYGVVYGVSTILMAVAMAPLLQRRSQDGLPTRHTGIFLSLALAVLLVNVPLTLDGLGSLGFFIIAGVAFVIGLRWRLRGIILAPLIIQAAYLLPIPLTTADYYDAPSAFELVNIALVAFPFAYFGMLSNRFQGVAGMRTDASLAAGDSS